jgi:predicted 2-oxoglutarate/Fe(II)-dependent dioxygenase YbiX|eukprot:COSAG06_NODE_3365_length_5449_cov_2.510280_4_plen_66_part_00
MQVPLNEPNVYDGGRLVFLTADGELECTSRTAGSATIHDNGVVHGVTEMTSGVRYALFVLRVRVQ